MYEWCWGQQWGQPKSDNPFNQVLPESNMNCMSGGVGDNNGDNPGGFDQLENGSSTTQGFASTSHPVDAKLHLHSYSSAVGV